MNGHLFYIDDEDKNENDRSFVNNADGQILQKTQQSKTLRNFVINNQALGTYGTGIDQDKPSVVSKVKVEITLYVINQVDVGGTSEFHITFKAGDKQEYRKIEDVANDSQHYSTVMGVSWPPVGGNLEVSVSGVEHDGSSANDALPTASFTVSAGNWNREGQEFISSTVENGHAKYYIKFKIFTDQTTENYSDTVKNFSTYQIVDAANSGAGSSNYRVGAGDSLQSIAQGAYGDAALWYLIADANGLSNNSTLQVGTMLTLPNAVGTVHNNANTFKLYNSSNIIGDTSPHLAEPPGMSKCQQIGTIIAAVLAAVVISLLAVAATAFTLGAAGVPALSGAGIAIAAIIGAVGGAVGSAASQGIMIAGGLQEHFSWGDVAVGGVTGLVSGLVGGGIAKAGAMLGKGLSVASKLASAGFSRSASLASKIVTGLGNFTNGASKSARALQFVGRIASETAQNMLDDALGQGVQILMGQQESFDWKSIALSAATTAGGSLGGEFGKLGGMIGEIAGSGLANLAMNGRDFDMESFVSNATSSVGSGMAGLMPDRNTTSNPKSYKIAITDRSQETAKSVRAYLMKHPDAEIIDVSNLADAAKVKSNDKLVVIGHNNGNGSSMMLGRFLKNMDNAPAKISLVVCNAASDVRGANLLQQTVAITKGRSTVSAHTGKIQLGSSGQRIVDSAFSRKLTYGNDGRYTSSASKHVKAEVEDGWLGNYKRGENRYHPYRSLNRADATDNQAVRPFQAWQDYRAPARLARRSGITPDHIPSVGAAFARLNATGVPDSLNRNTGLGRNIAYDMLPTMTVTAADHQRYSSTYGMRNSRGRINGDAHNYGAAIWRDVFAYTPALKNRGMSARAAWIEQTRQVDELTGANVRAGMMGPEENPFPRNNITRRHSSST